MVSREREGKGMGGREGGREKELDENQKGEALAREMAR